ncbi:MAG TPA: ABC transporter permease [Solirubrobacteraceae bacterium]|nr:ABC transporter permease [Solirubrobacteraceae bacterium]
MRWLLGKDLVILARSRLLVATLVIYPIAIALLIGLAISRSPGKPKVAIVDETPPGQTISVGGRQVEVGRYAAQIFDQVQPVAVDSRAQAVADIEAGRVLAAVVIPRDIAARISSGVSQGSVEVLYNGNALEQSLVQSQLNAALAQANVGFSQRIQQAAAGAIAALLQGGDAAVLGAPPDMIGLSQIPARLKEIVAHQPPGAEREQLERIEAFATFAAQNLDAARGALAAIGQPIAVKSTPVQGRRTPLDTFAVVVAVSVSLMFVCVLLAAGGLALEREEHVLARVLRGPPALVSREGLLGEKILLAAACGFVLALAMLAGVGAFVSLEWSRVGQWLVALACGGVAFGALGVAIGALAREVRAASLLAFGLALPLAFLALVPSGAVSHGVYDAIAAISFVFPFKAALQALDAAVNGASPGLGVSAIHLLLLSLLFAALARVGLRRLE